MPIIRTTTIHPRSSLSPLNRTRRHAPRYRSPLPNMDIQELCEAIETPEDQDVLLTELTDRYDWMLKIGVIQHMWRTSQRLRQEAERQVEEAKALFQQMENQGIHERLNWI